MKFHRKLTLVLAGLGLAAVMGFAGCERGISTPVGPTVIPSTVEPTDKIFVTVVAPAGVTPASIRITLRHSGAVVRDTTIANPVGTNTYTFGNLTPGGTYSVAVQGSGLTLQSVLLTIVSEVPPRATITLQPMVSTPSIEVVPDTPIAAGGTTVNVPPPTDFTEVAAGAPPAQVQFSGVDGTATVSFTSQSSVPVVVVNDAINSTVVSAVQINASDAIGTVAVTLPLPIATTEYARATGGTVDILVFDFSTMTWSTLQQATIKADGTVDATVSGLPADAIIAVGSTPAVSSLLTLVSSLRSFSAADIDAARASGLEAIATYELNPAVQYAASAKPAREDAVGKPAFIDAPGNIPPQIWAQVAPLIAARSTQLSAWIFGGQTDFSLEFPAHGVQAQGEIIRVQERFVFEFKFGGVRKTYTITVTYSNGRLTTIHISGSATGR